MSAGRMNPDEMRALGTGQHRIRCPECGRNDRDRTLGVTVRADNVVWHCYRCGTATPKRALRQMAYQRTTAVVAQTPTTEKHETLATSWRAFWRDLRGIRGTTAESYLRVRECALASNDIRYGELRHPSGYVGPCMVALVTNAVTGEPISLHRTWIKPDGRKANVEPPRLLLKGHRKQGGVIRLCADDEVTTGLAIAEGIETALAVARVFRPVWSVIDAGNMAAFPILNGIESLTIVADHDKTGIEAAHECARRWHAAGREVRIALPPDPKTDAADLASAA